MSIALLATAACALLKTFWLEVRHITSTRSQSYVLSQIVRLGHVSATWTNIWSTTGFFCRRPWHTYAVIMVLFFQRIELIYIYATPFVLVSINWTYTSSVICLCVNDLHFNMQCHFFRCQWTGLAYTVQFASFQYRLRVFITISMFCLIYQKVWCLSGVYIHLG